MTSYSRFSVLLSSLLLWVFICLIVYLKITASPAYFLTPDSSYYLEGAKNLANGNGFLIVFNDKLTHCTIWPIGYPGLIALFSKLSLVPVYGSSKIVNLLAIGLSMALLYSRLSGRSVYLYLAFCTSSLLQVYANTWSESVFLLALVGFSMSLSDEKPSGISIIGWGALAFLTRYIGGFVVLELAVLIGWKKLNRRPVRREITALMGLSGVILAYFGYNVMQSGSISGGHDQAPDEPFFQRLGAGLLDIAQEFLFLFRDWDWQNVVFPQPLFLFILLISGSQLGFLMLIGYRLYQYLSQNRSTSSDNLSRCFFLTALVYFLVLVLIYLTNASVGHLRFRWLAPSTLLLTLGGLTWLVDERRSKLRNAIRPWLIGVFLLSLIHALPKAFVLAILW